MEMDYPTSNNSRKLTKKLMKSQHIVENQTGIKCTMTATKNIVICNAGLVNGLCQETVYENFTKYGVLDEIVMLEGKSCAFVAFQTLESSIYAFNNINGKLQIGQDNKPLHLLFAPHLPNESVATHFNKKPNGCFVLDNFITEEEEILLLNLFDFSKSSNLKHRQVKHYGFEFRYDINNVDKDKPLDEGIPSECNFLWDRVRHCISDVSFTEPDQLTINCYKPGHGIPPHTDTHSAFEDVIFSLSLGSSIIMDFRHEDGRHYSVLLPRRSLTIMAGECRYNWTHGITPRKMDIISSDNGLKVLKRDTRVSFTFRKVLSGECNCQYFNKCDSYIRKTNLELKDSLAAELEEMHVHNVYENIANHFSDTRHTPWPQVLEFIDSLETGSVLVDVGCGNGKYLGHNNSIYNLGCDSSPSLIGVCKNRGHEVFVCNCINIPLESGIAGGVISIAVIHHLANTERRLRAVTEMVRILKVSGKALIYVWAKDQNKNKEKSSYLKQNRKNRKGDLVESKNADNVSVTKDISLPVHTNRTQFQHQDVLVPWKLKKEQKEASEDNMFLRFYHVFQEGELENLCKQIENVEIVKSYYDQGNWCIIIEKRR